jgi:hypothetical protein
MHKNLFYHSALFDPQKEYEPIKRYCYGESLAFQHDILNGLPKVYDECDIIYTEPAWQQGFYKFKKRRQDSGFGSFKQYMQSHHDFVSRSLLPIVIIGGKHHLKYLPSPDIILKDIKLLHGYKSLIFLYRLEFKSIHRTTSSILAELSQRFDKVGDFNCGYGNTGIAFVKAGKKFIMSDADPKCIGAIREYLCTGI